MASPESITKLRVGSSSGSTRAASREFRAAQCFHRRAFGRQALRSRPPLREMQDLLRR